MITCDCEAVKRKIIEISGYPSDKIVVFPWGVDLGLFRPEENKAALKSDLGVGDRPVIITTRTLSPVYGIEYFLRALPDVLRVHPRALALVVGTGPLDRQMRDLATSLGLRDHVHFAGNVPNEKLPRYLNAADIYVSPSLSDGTSLCLLEALACGLPGV